MTDTRSLLDRVRQPEYTGANRCFPCTVVNVVIATVASALLAALLPPAGLALFVVSLLSIYLRGYLVPGTPELTKRYLPASISDYFDDHETDDKEWETLEKVADHRENAVDPEQFLAEAGVVDSEGDADAFTDDFAAAYERELDAYRDAATARTTLASLFDADPEAVSFEDRSYPAIRIDNRIRKWPSEAALLADVAADAALSDWTDRWADVPVEQRHSIRTGLRVLVESCPACGGDLTETPESVESCCGVHQVIAVNCGECGDRLREVEPNKADAKLTR